MNDKTVVPTLHGGAGRGAAMMLPFCAEFNQNSQRFALAPIYVDPVPGRGGELASQAVHAGVLSTGWEARIEDIPDYSAWKAIVLQIDKPAPIARAIRAAARNECPVLQYLLLRLPTGELYGLRVALRPNEERMYEDLANFYEHLAAVTARSGHNYVIGERGRAEHMAIEPAFRAWFADHMKANIAKLSADLESDNQPIELTPDGKTTLWGTVCDSGESWSDPQELATRLAENPPLPLIRGEGFAIMECGGSNGIRIHTGKTRLLDGKLAVHETVLPDDEASAGDAANSAWQRLFERAERKTISKKQPVFVTD